MNLSEQIQIACIMEATARKPGNVHPAASFDDLCYDDFVRAAYAIAKPLTNIHDTGLGQAIFNAVQATRNATGTNVNLGIILAIAPLAAVPEQFRLDDGIHMVLEETTIDDAAHVYAAIRLAHPGGMGDASTQDIKDRPTVTLRQAMALAAKRDRIAEQYDNGFSQVFEARTQLRQFLSHNLDWELALVTLHLWMMSKWPDTLIARKCGLKIADEATQRAKELLDSTAPVDLLESAEFHGFDVWLRSDGHRRNPGTTADLIAATVFAAMRDDSMTPPSLERIRLRVTKIQTEYIEKSQ